MRASVVAAILTLTLHAAPSAAQAPAGGAAPPDPRPDLRIGLLAGGGYGSGSETALTLGLGAEVPVWRFLSVRGEYAEWGGTDYRTDYTVAELPGSHGGDNPDGRSFLLGLVADLLDPDMPSTSFYVGLSAGRYIRDSGGHRGDERVDSWAFALDAGFRFPIFRALGGRVGGRYLRADDLDLEVRSPGRTLSYSALHAGFELGIDW